MQNAFEEVRHVTLKGSGSRLVSFFPFMDFCTAFHFVDFCTVLHIFPHPSAYELWAQWAEGIVFIFTISQHWIQNMLSHMGALEQQSIQWAGEKEQEKREETMEVEDCIHAERNLTSFRIRREGAGANTISFPLPTPKSLSAYWYILQSYQTSP